MQKTELANYFAAEFERLVRADIRASRPLRPSERAELVQWLRHEFRRLAKAGGELHGPVYVDRTRRVVRVQPTLPPHQNHGMSLPACLRRPDTEAGLARLGLSHVAYTRLPQNPRLLAAMGRAALHEELAQRG